MFVFEEGELEVAISTYNRAPFVEAWLNKCLAACDKRNISIVIYDSSTNDDTEKLVNRINELRAVPLGYVRVPSEVLIGLKPMWAIMGSTEKYVWVAGDSRYPDFNEMDEKVFPLLAKDIDFITFFPGLTSSEHPASYTDKDLFLHDAFTSSTCIGTSIFRVGLFDRLKEDASLKHELDDAFGDNFGFAWLGYFFSLFGLYGVEAAYVDVRSYNVLSDMKVQTWARRFYGCWCEDLCNVIDGIPDVYKRKDLLPKHVWKVMGLDSMGYCLKGRVGGDLNPKTIERYKNNGMLVRCTNKVRRMERMASCPIRIAKALLLLFQMKSAVANYLRRFMARG